ncbi:PQQ-like beta-propeller repeat protein [Actinospica durhamensis]|uniref:PQQ-like beta-propeller repeat protein n=1 Tax=Actinospica durhamensis TaxID=1508375 RepID=A0A941EPW7_9ACTN|nr:PQQ-binding-like beta-propeller repeat protein [Actinospica durhamensis]MBR7836315.1 PQQ-like beta-propeller repeat protein [Actinospica durhamensis]
MTRRIGAVSGAGGGAAMWTRRGVLLAGVSLAAAGCSSSGGSSTPAGDTSAAPSDAAASASAGPSYVPSGSPTAAMSVNVAGDGGIYQLNGATGAVEWTYSGADTMCAGSLGNGLYVTDSGTGALAALGTGAKPYWTYSIGQKVSAPWASPVDESVYVSGADGTVYAINDAGPQLKWTYPTGQKAMTPFAPYDGGGVFVGAEGGYFYALDPASGSLNWSYQTGRAAAPQGTTRLRTLYLSIGEAIGAFDMADGTLQWKTPTNVGPSGAPVINDLNGGYLYAIGSNPGGISPNQLYCFDPTDGSVVWSQENSDNYLCDPAVGGGLVYLGVGGTVGSVGGGNGLIVAFEEQTGTQAWSTSTVGGSLVTAATYHDGVLYGTDTAGAAFALNAATGAVIWRNTKIGGQGYSQVAASFA